jgi:cell division transport system permease protein
MLTNFNRIIRFAFQDFSRNKGISIAAIFILLVTITLVTGLWFFHGMMSYMTAEIQNKIDIAAYFKEGTLEKDILAAKDEILKITPEIKGIDYVSQDQAMAIFNEKHGKNAALIKAIEQVGSNPFLPSLNITTNGDPVQYEQIANTLQNSDFARIIEKVDFSEKKETIQKIYSITSNINLFGLLLSGVLVIVAMLVVFNTIKLAVDSSKEEINTMKIVGASSWFVRGPFIVQGIIYGIVAFIFCFLLSGLTAFLLSSKISAILPGFNLFDFFLTDLWIFALIQLGFGVGLGVISSFIVVKKYLQN